MFDEVRKILDEADHKMDILHTDVRKRDNRISLLNAQIEDLKRQLADKDKEHVKEITEKNEAINNLSLQFMLVAEELGCASSKVKTAMETLEDGSLSARTHAILNSEN